MPSSTDWVATYHRRSWPDSGSRPDRAPIIRRQCSQNYQINSMYWGNFGDRARRPLQNQSCPFKRGPPERWPSGLRRTLGKRVCGKPYRGFESHSLRHISLKLLAFFKNFDTNPRRSPETAAAFCGRVRDCTGDRSARTAPAVAPGPTVGRGIAANTRTPQTCQHKVLRQVLVLSVQGSLRGDDFSWGRGTALSIVQQYSSI